MPGSYYDLTIEFPRNNFDVAEDAGARMATRLRLPGFVVIINITLFTEKMRITFSPSRSDKCRAAAESRQTMQQNPSADSIIIMGLRSALRGVPSSTVVDLAVDEVSQSVVWRIPRNRPTGQNQRHSYRLGNRFHDLRCPTSECTLLALWMEGAFNVMSYSPVSVPCHWCKWSAYTHLLDLFVQDI
jgi:hypothetical protein